MKNESDSVIVKLEHDAKEILDLKNKHRQKRPIVIEFSGSPKSGKTSCINSLEIFLKRNGFNVKTIQERASVCPVSDKRSPMFNIWTACEALAGMIGTLEKKDNNIDVLILDRGIFDAICWFDWLVKKEKMEESQRNVVENFLLQDELVRSIDIVFAFITKPEVSIEREYATLLTKKNGSIMNKKVLHEYKQSVEHIFATKDKAFHKVFKIDTTLKKQAEVGKEVTEYTLKALRDLLVEKICVVERKKAVKAFLNNNEHDYYEFGKLVTNKIKFVDRIMAENDDLYLQPIPIAVITNKDKTKVLVIRKKNTSVSQQSEEKNRDLIYVGGHSRYEDYTKDSNEDFFELCKSTLKREIKEEIGISVAINRVKPFLIYKPNSDRSRKHIAICFVIKQDLDTNFRLDSDELVMRKGKSKSGSFQDVSDINISELESWSIEIMKKVFGRNTQYEKQLSIFD